MKCQALDIALTWAAVCFSAVLSATLIIFPTYHKSRPSCQKSRPTSLSRFRAGRSQFLAGRSRFQAGRSRFLASRKNNKSGAERGAKGDSRPGPRTKVNAISKEDIFKKKIIKWPDTLICIFWLWCIYIIYSLLQKKQYSFFLLVAKMYCRISTNQIWSLTS